MKNKIGFPLILERLCDCHVASGLWGAELQGYTKGRKASLVTVAARAKGNGLQKVECIQGLPRR